MKNDTSKITKQNLSAMTAAGFDEAKGEVFGGSADVLTLNVGEVAGPLTHVTILPAQTLDPANDPVDVWVASQPDGREQRMPAAAIFRSQAEQACFEPGDSYLLKREPDSIKKNGRGKGRPMANFRLKVIGRVDAPAAAKRVKLFADELKARRAREAAPASNARRASGAKTRK